MTRSDMAVIGYSCRYPRLERKSVYTLYYAALVYAETSWKQPSYSFITLVFLRIFITKAYYSQMCASHYMLLKIINVKELY